MTVTAEQQPRVMVTFDGDLIIDGRPVCPFCLEDAGTPWCDCIPPLTEPDRREPKP